MIRPIDEHYCTPIGTDRKSQFTQHRTPSIVSNGNFGRCDNWISNLDNLFVPITKGPKATAYDDHAIHNFGDAANNHHKTQSSSINDRITPSSAIGTRPRKGFSSPLLISNNRNNGPRSITIMGNTHDAKTWYTNLPIHRIAQTMNWVSLPIQ
jgi:hypothetical protein